MELFGQVDTHQPSSRPSVDLAVGQRVLRTNYTDIYVVLRVDSAAGCADLLRLKHVGENRIEENVSINDLVRLSAFGPGAAEQIEAA